MLREGPAPVVRREDYAPPAYWIHEVELGFDLDPAKTIVSSRMSVQRHPDTPAGTPLVLHGEALTLLRVLADGESVAFRHDDSGALVIDPPPAAERFTLEIRNAIAPERNTELSGLYTSASGFFTQCEAQGFRRITYFLDRPDVMAVYTVTLRADRSRYPTLLSNGNLLEQGELDGGRHFAKWHDPHRKPSYLFALVAADLVCREQRVRSRAGRDHLLQIYVRRGDLDKTEHAMNSLVASLVWDEARFGLSLDLERFMIVAVEDFNMGAMENKGLNIFNTAYVLANPACATDTDFADIESVVAHEYFHNWTGNRVTCRDWFQLSLKEGLTVYRDQEFSQDMAGAASARAVCRIGDVKRLRARQFPEDAGAMAHPVRPDSYMAIDNFYTATVYEKGAEVVRMMATLVGREGFRRGMALYFQRHDGQAVTCDDFAQALADANPNTALALALPAFKRWYSQAGTPVLKARHTWDAEAKTLTLQFQQHTPATPGQADKQPLVIPLALGLVAEDGTPLPLQLKGEASPDGTERVVVLTQAEQSCTFINVEQPAVPSLLRGFSAPLRLDDGLDDAALLTLLRHDADPFNRWEAGQRLALARLLRGVADEKAALLDAPFVAAMRAVLRHPQLDPALKELVLSLPAEDYVAEQLASVDPQRIHRVRETLRAGLAYALHDDWLWAWEQHQVPEGYAPSPAQSGRRALANLALGMLVLRAVRSGDAVWQGKAYQRFKHAANMTDRHGALQALVDAGSELASTALDRFHDLHADDALVIDKWFTVQAQAPEQDDGRVFQRVKALMAHPDFTLKNPNRARALVLRYCLNNPAAFHRDDAAGYVFWSERVQELDALNPQLAARLARAMDRWPQLAEPWRSAAREAVDRLAARPRLSDDVREILSKALAAG